MFQLSDRKYQISLFLTYRPMQKELEFIAVRYKFLWIVFKHYILIDYTDELGMNIVRYSLSF